MIIKENELKEIIIFIIQPYLKKYGFHLLESQLWIDDYIHIQADIEYNHQNIKAQIQCKMQYQNNQFILNHISGTIKYSIMELPVLKVLKQFLPTDFKMIDERIIYSLALPITSLELKNHYLIINIESD